MKHRCHLPALLAALLVLTPRGAWADPPEAPRTPFDYRSGAHLGVGIGPTTIWIPDRSRVDWGMMMRLVVNVGIAPALDFRTGLYADGSGSGTSCLSMGVPMGFRVNLGSVYSMAFGASAGLVTDTAIMGLSLGPEWTLLGLRIGRRREFELEVSQAVHIHVGDTRGALDLTHLQTSLMLTYLSLGPIDAR